MTPEEILRSTRTIAVVGCSRDPYKDAHDVPRAMQEAGFCIIPVNPYADEILGERCYARLEDVDKPFDLVNVFRPAAEAPAVARSAAAVGARAFWLQLGLRSPEARRICERAGIAYVEDLCIQIERRRLGLRL